MMRSLLTLALTALLGGAAQAQTGPAPAAAAPSAGAPRGDRYIQGLGGWTFGDKGSQYFGAEGGFTWKPNLHVFVEGGRVNNAGGSAASDAAAIVAEGLGRTHARVTSDVVQPTTFFGGGLRYHANVTGSRAEPFVLAGGGVSIVQQKATFAIGGTDVTSTLDQYGVVLGTDLSGSFTKAHVVLGGGLALRLSHQTFLEVGYRMMRIFAEDQGITINRAGIGVGLRF